MSIEPSILVVDNYDSFVYNLVQYLGELGARVIVRRNDDVGAADLASLGINGVLISPGPGRPSAAGNCLSIVRQCAELSLPMLGVCLGHQVLGEAFGATVDRAPGTPARSREPGDPRRARSLSLGGRSARGRSLSLTGGARGHAARRPWK